MGDSDDSDAHKKIWATRTHTDSHCSQGDICTFDFLFNTVETALISGAASASDSAFESLRKKAFMPSGGDISKRRPVLLQRALLDAQKRYAIPCCTWPRGTVRPRSSTGS
jgi:hypothetical protein